MDIYKINETILNVLEYCSVKHFPINCYEVLDKLKIHYIKYSSLTPPKRRSVSLVSEDAFTLNKVIYYNDKINSRHRIRFSIYHEIGHIIFGHTVDNEENNFIADYFASLILAPRVMIQHYNCKNSDDVRRKFDVSQSAANRIWMDYKKWALHPRSILDYNILKWFTGIATPFDNPESEVKLISTTKIYVEKPAGHSYKNTGEIPDHLPEHIKKRIIALHERREKIKIMRESVDYYKDIKSIRIQDIS